MHSQSYVLYVWKLKHHVPLQGEQRYNSLVSSVSHVSVKQTITTKVVLYSVITFLSRCPILPLCFVAALRCSSVITAVRWGFCCKQDFKHSNTCTYIFMHIHSFCVCHFILRGALNELPKEISKGTLSNDSIHHSKSHSNTHTPGRTHTHRRTCNMSKEPCGTCLLSCHSLPSIIPLFCPSTSCGWPRRWRQMRLLVLTS